MESKKEKIFNLKGDVVYPETVVEQVVDLKVNPADEATATLTKIKLGDTVYSISGGSSMTDEQVNTLIANYISENFGTEDEEF